MVPYEISEGGAACVGVIRTVKPSSLSDVPCIVLGAGQVKGRQGSNQPNFFSIKNGNYCFIIQTIETKAFLFSTEA
jgi:hypothetical protein